MISLPREFAAIASRKRRNAIERDVSILLLIFAAGVLALCVWATVDMDTRLDPVRSANAQWREACRAASAHNTPACQGAPQ